MALPRLLTNYRFWIVVTITTLCVTIIFFTGFQVSASLYSRNRIMSKLENLSFEEKIKELRKSHHYYKKASSEELLVRWIKLFSGSIYQLNGDGKYGKYDCVSSCYYFFNTFGGIAPVDNVVNTQKKLERLVKLGFAKKRTNYYDIKPGDILISHDSGHMSIIMSKSNNFLTYGDVNYKLKTMGIQNIHYKHKNVTGIYEVSFQFWAGSIFKEK